MGKESSYRESRRTYPGYMNQNEHDRQRRQLDSMVNSIIKVPVTKKKPKIKPQSPTTIKLRPVENSGNKIEKTGRFCCMCEERISEGVYDYSTRSFRKPLCMTHQQEIRKSKQNSQITQKNKNYYCNKCKKTITYVELKYSLWKFKRILCIRCQSVESI